MTKNKKNNSSKTIVEGSQLRISIQRLQTFLNHFPLLVHFPIWKRTTKEGQKSFRKSQIGKELNQGREKRRENSRNHQKNSQMNSKTMWI